MLVETCRLALLTYAIVADLKARLDMLELQERVAPLLTEAGDRDTHTHTQWLVIAVVLRCL